MKRLAIRVLGLLLLGLVFVATLTPASTSDATAWHLGLNAADAVRNIALFVPIGGLFALSGMRSRRALLSFLWRRALLKLRGRRWKARARGQIPMEQLTTQLKKRPSNREFIHLISAAKVAD